jgi:Flp pilus assembly protein TadG
MGSSFHRGGRRRGSVGILFTFMAPLVLVPLAGLAIDGCRLYIVQAKLSSAVDGAALGAGRLLGTTANTTEIAGEFLNANFPTGFWGSTNLQPNIQFVKTFILNRITVSATVDVPLLFLAVFKQSKSTVAATAVATRKETRVELVIDRSGTMSGQLGAVKSTASQFAQSFISGYDEMGLVVFSGSGVVGYPTTRPYNYSPTSAGGPDNSFLTTQANGNILDMLSDLGSGSWTNMSDGLALAYLELQKADHRDNDPTRLNAIVLFTDGFPNAFSSYANDPSNNSLKPTSQSSCTYNPATAGTASTHMVGWAGGGTGSSGSVSGLYFLGSSDNNTTAYWMTYSGKPDESLGTGNLKTAVAGCAYLNQSSPNLADLNKIPPQTYWGDSTSDGTAYQSSPYYSGLTYDSTKPNIQGNAGIAGWNATDNVGKRILGDTNLNVTIYTIGYTGSGGNPDTYLLKRLSNTTDSTNRNTSWQTGQYVPASNTDELAQAFQAVAASILRLAQ